MYLWAARQLSQLQPCVIPFIHPKRQSAAGFLVHLPSISVMETSGDTTESPVGPRMICRRWEPSQTRIPVRSEPATAPPSRRRLRSPHVGLSDAHAFAMLLQLAPRDTPNSGLPRVTAFSLGNFPAAGTPHVAAQSQGPARWMSPWTVVDTKSSELHAAPSSSTHSLVSADWLVPGRNALGGPCEIPSRARFDPAGTSNHCRRFTVALPAAPTLAPDTAVHSLPSKPREWFLDALVSQPESFKISRLKYQSMLLSLPRSVTACRRSCPGFVLRRGPHFLDARCAVVRVACPLSRPLCMKSSFTGCRPHGALIPAEGMNGVHHAARPFPEEPPWR
jgi:hypothetical protein